MNINNYKINRKYDNCLCLNLYKSNKEKNNIPCYEPKTKQQLEYLNALENKNIKIIIVIGPAGSGKTLFACQNAIKLLLQNTLKKIIITRPIVLSSDNDLGSLPGTLINKMAPWTKPMFDIFLEYISKPELNFMLQNEIIEICPLGFMRGRTFKNTFVIADEMQNSTPTQIKMLMTRLGENSNLVITGDLEQVDINITNGLADFLDKIKDYNTNLIKVIEFDKNDICRSIITEEIIKIYEQNINKNQNNINVHSCSEVASCPLRPEGAEARTNIYESERMDIIYADSYTDI